MYIVTYQFGGILNGLVQTFKILSSWGNAHLRSCGKSGGIPSLYKMYDTDDLVTSMKLGRILRTGSKGEDLGERTYGCQCMFAACKCMDSGLENDNLITIVSF